jgi:hypothetical protein
MESEEEEEEYHEEVEEDEAALGTHKRTKSKRKRDW